MEHVSGRTGFDSPGLECIGGRGFDSPGVSRFVHQIPARASPDYALMAARLLAMGVTPSVDFTSAV